MTWRCKQCGSDDVQTAAWINPNTEEVLDDFGSWDETDTKWCNDCEEHVVLEDDEEPEARRDCPGCGSENGPMGTLGTRKHYRCRMCGLDYSDDGKDADTEPGAFPEKGGAR